MKIRELLEATVYRVMDKDTNEVLGQSETAGGARELAAKLSKRKKRKLIVLPFFDE